MSKKVIRFSRVFPSKHPKKGKPTFFVEQILNWYWETQDHKFNGIEDMIFLLNPNKPAELLREFLNSLNPDIKTWKSHTIRAGERFKAGDIADCRVWSGRPYFTTDIIILPEIKIPKIWEIKKTPGLNSHFTMMGTSLKTTVEFVANNDGLTLEDFKNWFPQPFEGQIICWNELIEY